MKPIPLRNEPNSDANFINQWNLIGRGSTDKPTDRPVLPLNKQNPLPSTTTTTTQQISFLPPAGPSVKPQPNLPKVPVPWPQVKKQTPVQSKNPPPKPLQPSVRWPAQPSVTPTGGLKKEKSSNPPGSSLDMCSCWS